MGSAESTAPQANAPPSTTDARLEYAPKPPLRRRRAFRLAMIVLVGLAAGIAGWRWGPGAWQNARLLYWQRRCMTYAPPADLVVYEEEPAPAEALLSGRGGEYVRGGDGTSFTCAMRHPGCLTEFARASGMGSVSNGAVIFMHERTSRTGLRRLVIITASPADVPSMTLTGGLDEWECTPGTWGTPPQFSSPPISRLVPIRTDKAPRVRFFAGQADPNDASHFTIGYDLDGKPGTLQGWLSDSGGWVGWGQPPWGGGR